MLLNHNAGHASTLTVRNESADTAVKVNFGTRSTHDILAFDQFNIAC
jgi:hypothetical protein